MSRTALIEAYLAGGETLRAAVAGLPRDQWTSLPGPGAWSILEVVCHLADSEALFTDRMKRVVVEERPPLIYADAAAFVAGLACPVRDLPEEVELLSAMRRQMARILEAQPESAWSRIGIHSRQGEQTLEQLLQKAIVHLEHHVGFIRRKREALVVM
ncbi:DinB superfamily protein [Caulifigura coniformis]|uniref:DinB superfamily protein n=1 Tax=Caulifigura coniformis TaxID=2527983 RepID=A0A517SIR3_9PLAN|nr:DinB family protein [Caulifigura coniformis]QDT56002.1 DinB superfamily protein [Caulifigura coniformis]